MIDRNCDTTDEAKRARIALAHDWLCGKRGGEQVLERIAALIAREHAPGGLYTMFADGRSIGPAVDASRPEVSWLNGLPFGAGRLRRWLLPLYPSAVAHLSRSLRRSHAGEPIDLLISTSSAAIKSMNPPAGVPHLCYCHAPARYVWSRAGDYTRSGGIGALGLRLIAPAYRRWDRRTSRRVTRFIANSTYIRGEIARCYERDADVVHPPVRTEFFRPDPTAERSDRLLVVSALEPYKRVDLAIAAANAARLPLTIIGAGSDEPRLRTLAGSSVTFAGRVSDDVLRASYQRARAMLFPQVEDFGIAAVEAQACGTPVVAFRAGGALDIVVDGRSGALFDEPAPESLLDALDRLPVDPAACRRNAERFSESSFDQRMRRIIEAELAG